MSELESLSGITTFVVVAKASSFTKAGQLLGISKSAVGKAVFRLEERLGVKLFHRTTRRLSLTSDGEAYFSVWSAALESIAEAENNLGGRLNVPAGRLRVDMPVAFGRKLVLPMLLAIAKKYPALQMTLSFTDSVIDLLEEGVDLAIRFGTLEDSTEIVARKLTSHRWVICATPEYLARFGTPLAPQDVGLHRCIVGHRRGQPLAWHLSQDGVATRLMPPPTYQIGDGQAMIDAAVDGIGLCQMPLALFRSQIETGRLRTVLDAYTEREIDVHAVWPRTAHLRPKVRHVVDALVELGKSGQLD
ncbi:MAG: LysR family transcriptional regulator [Janthinobacterium lividum]